MIEPQPISMSALVTYWAFMAVIMPFGGWPLFLVQLMSPTAGRNRLTAVLNVWFVGTTLGVSAVCWLYSLLSYDSSAMRVDFAHRLIPYMPKTGIAVGLFGLCALVSCGIWGIVASFVRPQMALAGAVITGCVLFAVIYGCGWLFVST